VVSRSAVDRAAGGSAAVLAGDRCRLVERGGGREGGGVAGGWQPVVPRRWRDAANLVGPAVLRPPTELHFKYEEAGAIEGWIASVPEKSAVAAGKASA
jgi:hypothetical protein